MELRDALDLIWSNRKYTPSDSKTALSHLNEEVAESLKALLRDDNDKAKRELEDALSCLLIAMKIMDIDIEDAIERQIIQMQKRADKVMVFKKDKVEILVNNVLKGGWSIWSSEDIKDAQKMAKEFGCSIIYEDKGNI
ncbi:MazG nucleotide pyrophosphohydrolase domain protein [Oxobacter pfennigii]|uniref:MazG nucleotide pyrophosphohydrolase domain protein n=1 Tax=Oxobacter pfennigii TaxID=36849 RepID=A0A0P9AHC3_9CLOT|nr:MazG nucleotide pyrophosphohydrolase domain-containing protein [Oxobacter pfennigii]KPU44869.1 MazG nucleotide pyrophosphohydrolase domain protein [Oxobacter pfennigii]